METVKELHMGEKYIKGKDGKFQGSAPDAATTPASSPVLPKKPERSSEKITESFTDNDGNLAFRYTEEYQREFMRNLVKGGF